MIDFAGMENQSSCRWKVDLTLSVMPSIADFEGLCIASIFSMCQSDTSRRRIHRTTQVVFSMEAIPCANGNYHQPSEFRALSGLGSSKKL